MQNLPANSLRKILLLITAVFRGDYLSHLAQASTLRDSIYQAVQFGRLSEAYKIKLATQLKHLHTFLELSQDRSITTGRLFNSSYIAISDFFSSMDFSKEKTKEIIATLDKEFDEVIKKLDESQLNSKAINHSYAVLSYLKLDL